MSYKRIFMNRLISIFFLFALCAATFGGCKKESSSLSVHNLVTGEGVKSGRSGWDKFFNTKTYVFGKSPIPFLKANIARLRKGKALVLAMGEGRNAVYLARHGFDVDGVDISEVALRKARLLAREYNVKINTINANLRDYEIKKNHYDLIVNVTYFRKELIPHVKDGLKPGGFVIFENYTLDHLKTDKGASIPRRFLVEKNQLKSLFNEFEILEYVETRTEKEAIVDLLARKK